MTNQNLYQNILDGGGQQLINKTKQTVEYFSEAEKGRINNSNQLVALNNSWNTGKPLDDGRVSPDSTFDIVQTGVEIFTAGLEDINEVMSIASDPHEIARQAGQAVQVGQETLYKFISQGPAVAKSWFAGEQPQQKRLNER